MPIAQDIPSGTSRSGASRFASAIRYAATLNDVASEIAAVSERFSPSTARVHRGEEDGAPRRGERVQQVILSGLFDLETAAIELEAIAALRPRVSNPVRHIVLSYDAARGEDPTPEEIERDVEILLRHRGFTNARDRGEHDHGTAVARFEAARAGEVSPHVAIVHGDTDTTHVHIIANTVAPNGAVNPDFRAYAANEFAAAMIAEAHGWEIVAGRKNGRLVADQARARGASKLEIDALLRRDAVTLNRLRERDGDEAPRRGLARAEAGRSKRRGGFVATYANAIRDALYTSVTFGEFTDACRDVGVIVKFSEVTERKTGRVLARLAFADVFDRAGDSGSRVGVTAKAVLAKFGPLIPVTGDSGIAVGVRSLSVPEGGMRAWVDWSPSPRGDPKTGSVDPHLPGRGGISPPPSEPIRDHTASRGQARQLSPDVRSLVDAVLRRTPGAPIRSDPLTMTLAVLGFASRSMRTLRRQRRERRRGQVADLSAIRAPRSTVLERMLERLSVKRATVLARDVRTSAGAEARDLALADLDLRTAYAAWSEAEAAKQRVAIEAERAEAHEAHRRETERQLRRMWEVEKLFRGALRSAGLRGAALADAIAEAYQARRSALKASRRAAWAAVVRKRLSVRDYVAWLGDQDGPVADRARLHLEVSKRGEGRTTSLEASLGGTPAGSIPPAVTARPTATAPVQPRAQTAAARRVDRFSAIFERSDAEALQNEALRRADYGAGRHDDARGDREAMSERAVVKAARKILGETALPLLDQVSRAPLGPERTAALAAIRDAVLAVGRQRRARRSMKPPTGHEVGKVRRDTRSRGR